MKAVVFINYGPLTVSLKLWIPMGLVLQIVEAYRYVDEGLKMGDVIIAIQETLKK